MSAGPEDLVDIEGPAPQRPARVLAPVPEVAPRWPQSVSRPDPQAPRGRIPPNPPNETQVLLLLVLAWGLPLTMYGFVWGTGVGEMRLLELVAITVVSFPFVWWPYGRVSLLVALAWYRGTDLETTGWRRGRSVADPLDLDPAPSGGSSRGCGHDSGGDGGSGFDLDIDVG